MPRTLAVILVACLAVLILCAPASADPPTRKLETLVFDEPLPLFPCANGKDVMGTFTLTRVVVTFTDGAGRPTREVRHVHFHGRQTSADGARSAPWFGVLRRELDFASSLLTLDGVMNWTRLPGRDAINAGRRVMDGDAIVSERGLGIEQYERSVCAYLYP